jgi:hypothetical protein
MWGVLSSSCGEVSDAFLTVKLEGRHIRILWWVSISWEPRKSASSSNAGMREQRAVSLFVTVSLTTLSVCLWCNKGEAVGVWWWPPWVSGCEHECAECELNCYSMWILLSCCPRWCHWALKRWSVEVLGSYWSDLFRCWCWQLPRRLKLVPLLTTCLIYDTSREY